MEITHSVVKVPGDHIDAIDDWNAIHHVTSFGRAKSASTTYLSVPGSAPYATASSAHVTGVTYYEPIDVCHAITIDQITIEVTLAAAAGNTIRIAIYNCDSDLQPTTLIQDFGTLAIDSVTVVNKAVSITLQPGRYMVAYRISANASLRYVYGMSLTGSISPTLGSSGSITNYSVVEVYGAFPANATKWTTANLGVSGNWHVTLFRISSYP